MFRLENGTTLVMHRGNTGTLRIRLRGYTFGSVDRVLFMMKSMSGTEIKSKICEVDENGYIEIPFVNTDTDYLSPGQYKWAITAATDPEYEEGKIVNGSGVCTPRDDMFIRIVDTAALI